MSTGRGRIEHTLAVLRATVDELATIDVETISDSERAAIKSLITVCGIIRIQNFFQILSGLRLTATEYCVKMLSCPVDNRPVNTPLMKIVEGMSR